MLVTRYIERKSIIEMWKQIADFTCSTMYDMGLHSYRRRSLPLAAVELAGYMNTPP